MDNTTLYYEFARERLRSQEALNVEYDTKVNHTITLGVALVSIGVLITNLAGNSLSENSWLWVPAGMLVLSFAAIVVFSLKSRWLSDWHNGPLEERFVEYVKEMDSDILQEWVNGCYSKALRCNDATLSRKARWFGYMQYGLFGEVLALIAVSATCCLS